MLHKWEELQEDDPEGYTCPGRVNLLWGHILVQNHLNPHCPNYCASLFVCFEYHFEIHLYFERINMF